MRAQCASAVIENRNRKSSCLIWRCISLAEWNCTLTALEAFHEVLPVAETMVAIRYRGETHRSGDRNQQWRSKWECGTDSCHGDRRTREQARYRRESGRQISGIKAGRRYEKAASPGAPVVDPAFPDNICFTITMGIRMRRRRLSKGLPTRHR